MLKYVLLGFLNYRPSSGYDLRQLMEDSTAYFWHAKLSQIYITLKELEEAGLLTSTVEEQRDRPDKRIYTITPAGKQTLQGWLSQPVTDLSPKKEALVLKIFFSAGLEKEAILLQLRLQRRLHQEQVKLYDTRLVGLIQEAAANEPHFQRDALLWEATRRFGTMYEELYVRWLDETIQLVEEKFESNASSTEIK